VDYRFRDKVYLCDYRLDTALFDKFGFEVEDAAPIRSVYMLSTDKGMKILKKIDYSLGELMFIYNALNEIRKQYPYVINFRQSTTGEPYVQHKNDIYIVLDMIEGRDCLYENLIDLKNASRALARLHKAGQGTSTACCEVKNKLGRLEECYKRKITDMEKYKEIAAMHVNKSPFDRAFLKGVDYYLNNARDALKALQESSYLKLCSKGHTLCHHDLAHRNILIDNNDNVYFLDFDYSLVDIPCHDIANMINKALRHNEWSSEISDTILNSYSEEYPLSEEEMNVLAAYLMFPQEFYDVATAYYMKTRNWEEEEFLDKLMRKLSYRDDREAFLKDMKERLM
jgi:CotS family spore coat protein